MLQLIKYCVLLTLILCRETVSQEPLDLLRGVSEEVPLATTALTGHQFGFGSPNRAADHATVAMNSNKDILVAFHTVRDWTFPGELLPPPGDTTYQGGMKQVEVAFFEYDDLAGYDKWNFVETRILGSVEHNPISNLVQPLVKCERPDVIAVGDRFFVVWTRRYSSNSGFPNQENEPASLECAWVEIENNGMTVHGTDSPVAGPGLGYILDAHLPGGSHDFHIRECAGVADAVALNGDDPNLLEVAVVYPHYLSSTSTQPIHRNFELRVVKCEFNVGTKARTKTEYPPLWGSVPFHGAPAPAGVITPGLILPDLAPSTEQRAFWLVHERQKLMSSGGTPSELVPDGRIKLEYYLLEDFQTNPPGEWVQKAAKTFLGTTGSWSWKRRPMISTFAEDTSGQQVVSICFATSQSGENPVDASSNVVYEHWEYEQGSLISPPTYPGISLPLWDDLEFNPSFTLDRPVPVHGRTMPQVQIRRCYFTGTPYGSTSPTKLLHWNPFTVPGTESLVDTDLYNNFTGLRRPAATYKYFPLESIPDYYAATWEKLDENNVKRVYINME